ncbi:rhodanese-like domain-containing protein [Motilimonas sp. 1_MG-2023]|uniref:rhodanese-like domain-containing protein n=1 Tax=Motilimonas sp. 1_MG-2023 TaxID=3062672 RepID=UPI0026E3DF97|nr:rhodanese-like domain-containing protein [Motilimonas sp. 1_MG-2023]MDO6524471.1 rhodanese-like domain-containing protein [Motilimonas sp. 1_MG-2023]
MQHSTRFLTLVDQARAQIQETDIPTVKAWLDAGKEFVLIDNREESEWAKGHIPCAIYLGRGILERDIEQRCPDLATEIVVYCGGGYRSALSVENLQKMGYTKVISMDGGFRGWKEAGHEIAE